MDESISLEETNKIRIKLGLKPLTDDKASADTAEQAAEKNYAKRRDEEKKEAEKKRIQDSIAKVKNKRELNASLKGATLGDADADVDDTLKWLKKAKKREKELAKKRMAELENMDKQFQGADYTEKDLEGLKVSHDFEGLDEGEDRVLTLKDSRILDNEEDELQNVEMAELERTKQLNELKTKRDYKGYDDDEFAEGQAGIRKSILAKYDEDIEGPQETGFRLGSSVPRKADRIKEEQAQAAAAVNKSLLSIDYAKNMEIADYLQEGDVGFKKPKTKKKRPSRRVVGDSEIDQAKTMDSMDVDGLAPAPRARNLDDNFVDDDELQASLARARRAKLKKPKGPTQEEIARRVAEERAQSNGADEPKIKAEDGEPGEGLVFDDTSEFIRSVQYNPITIKTEPKDEIPQVKTEPSRDVDMPDAEENEEPEPGEIDMKDEEDAEAMLHALQNAMDEAEATGPAVKKEDGEFEVGTSAAQVHTTGLAATLNILRQQGILSSRKDDLVERERTQKRRDLWLAEWRTKNALSELEACWADGSGLSERQTFKRGVGS